MKIVGLAVLLAIFFWCYAPVWRQLFQAWSTEPDYSHGFLVIPMAAIFCWLRRDTAPRVAPGLAWGGFLLLGLACLMHWAAAMAYIDAVAGWSMLLWIAGFVWFAAGWRVLAWAGPAIAFLLFMVPLPFRGEQLLSGPLQSTAAKLSCWTLQLLGQPALREGNTILLGDHRLAVEEACSGLRIFVSVLALAFAYIILVQRTWWERLWLLLSTLPIALTVNAGRIVVTGLLATFVSGEAAFKFSHDLAGLFMIPCAAAMFGFVLWYLGKLFRAVDQVDMSSLVRRPRSPEPDSATA